MYDFIHSTTNREPPSLAHLALFERIGATCNVVDGELLGIEFAATRRHVSPQDRAVLLGVRDRLIELSEPITEILLNTAQLALDRYDTETGELFAVGLIDESLEEIGSDDPQQVLTISYQENVRLDSPGDRTELEIGLERRMQTLILRAMRATSSAFNTTENLDGAMPELTKDPTDFRRNEPQQTPLAINPLVFLEHQDDELPSHNTSDSPFSAIFRIEKKLITQSIEVTFSLAKFDSHSHLNFVVPLDNDGLVGCKVRREAEFAVTSLTSAHLSIVREYSAILLDRIERLIAEKHS